MELYQCPYNKACKCAMKEPCFGCEDFKPNEFDVDKKEKHLCPNCEKETHSSEWHCVECDSYGVY